MKHMKITKKSSNLYGVHYSVHGLAFISREKAKKYLKFWNKVQAGVVTPIF